MTKPAATTAKPAKSSPSETTSDLITLGQQAMQELRSRGLRQTEKFLERFVRALDDHGA